MSLEPKQEQQYNHYAKMARAEFEKSWTRMDAAAVARWWNNWCVSGKTEAVKAYLPD